jgi:SH3 domain containing protein/NlpC/P60 family protein
MTHNAQPENAAMHTRIRFHLLFLVGLALPATFAIAGGEPLAAPAHGIPGIQAEQLTPAFWIARAPDPDRVLVDPATIDARNAKLDQVDKTMHDLQTLPTTLTRSQILAWLDEVSGRPTRQLFDIKGEALRAATLDALVEDLAKGKIPETVTARHGLVVHRAALRSFPTRLQVFRRKGDTDIDRFQETALFPGTPVVVAHESADAQWWFVVSPRYAAWIEKTSVALGTAEQVFGYAQKKPYRVVTGAYVRTVTTPEQPALSELRLDMSTRVPLLPDWPPTQTVNGQHPYAGYVLELPLRADDGSLHFAPALLQKVADTAPDYLPLTRANILRQAFKFLGERYGWGHANDARDCSGFVSDVYRSMGVAMPRNTRDQSVSPGLDHRLFGAGDDRAARAAAARALAVGDLVYIPGHVMMAIGAIGGEPYVIHDTGGMSYRNGEGSIVHVDLNEVAVTPLMPLLFNDTETYVDRMTSIVRIAPGPERPADPLDSAKDPAPPP